MKFIIMRSLALFFLMMVSHGAYAIGWAGASGTCVSGGYNTIQYSGYCDWKSGTDAYYAEGQPISFLMSQGGNTGDSHAFVPYPGNFQLKLYWCNYPANMDTCSKAGGTVLITGELVRLEPTRSLDEQKIYINDQTRKAPSAGGYCFTISDPETGYEYRGNMGYGPDGRGKFCEDAYKLPVEPPKCIFNSDADLDIQLGQLERGDIAVKAGASSPVTKDITVSCGGNIVYNANMKLDYTPISVSNDNVVSTSTKGLGVAVLYKGKAIQPGDSFPLSYQPGINTLTLGFEAVRDPAMASGDLKTGDFTANAVLVFTEQ
ncbi:fimbrial protein [Morganella psychrotolerans]|uniref:Fimbrial protein n=1 Tax=Morganella psychrotolerans TaxID=368603 RepID=A0A1B8HNS6_9GAMM|nr:fimbrial protein [Morganella psychrotolerans]OBU10920.1 fimbrial protein [Morganella psychrotolerans]